MRQKSWIIVALAGVVLVVFGRLCINDFAGFDDAMTIYANPRFNPPSIGNIAWYWSHWEAGIYIPLTETIWGLLAFIARVEPDEMHISLNPWIFHSASVLIHLLTTIGVFALLRRLIGKDLPAVAGAILFAVHPVQVETVAWASGLKDALCGLFSVLCLCFYVDFVRKSGSWRTYAGATACFVCAFLAKPTGIVVPLMAIAMGWMALGRPLGKVLRSLWPWLILAAAGAVLTRYVQRGERVPGVAVWARPLIAGDALAFYAYKLLVPLKLAPDYGMRPQDVMVGKWAYFAWIVPVLIALALWISRKSRPMLALAGLFSLIPLLPVLGFSPFLFQGFSTTADHYLYLPMVGAALALGWLIAHHGGRRLWTACVVWLAALASLSFVQGGYWSTDRRLWEHTLTVNPRSFAAMTGLAFDSMRNRNLAGVEERLKKAQDLAPYYVPLAQIQVQYYLMVGNADRAIDSSRRLEDLKERYTNIPPAQAAEAHRQLGQLLMARKRYREAAAEFRRAMELDPSAGQNHNDLKQAQERATTQP